jgi:adenylate kinase family enzyme
MDFFVKIFFTTKLGGYNVVCQTIVDDQKKFTNIFVGLPRSVNDFRMLKRFVTYYFVQSRGFFSVDKGLERFARLFY